MRPDSRQGMALGETQIERQGGAPQWRQVLPDTSDGAENMGNLHRNGNDGENNYFAGAPTGHASSRLIVALAVVTAFACAWTLWSQGTASMARSADAGPPAPSALNIQKQAQNEERERALDSGVQREQLISEMRQLRYEVAGIRELLQSGQIRSEVTNFADLKQPDVKIDIDYAKLRDALRQP